jgi:hypothetical protein
MLSIRQTYVHCSISLSCINLHCEFLDKQKDRNCTYRLPLLLYQSLGTEVVAEIV